MHLEGRVAQFIQMQNCLPKSRLQVEQLKISYAKIKESILQYEKIQYIQYLQFLSTTINSLPSFNTPPLKQKRVIDKNIIPQTYYKQIYHPQQPDIFIINRREHLFLASLSIIIQNRRQFKIIQCQKVAYYIPRKKLYQLKQREYKNYAYISNFPILPFFTTLITFKSFLQKINTILINCKQTSTIKTSFLLTTSLSSIHQLIHQIIYECSLPFPQFQITPIPMKNQQQLCYFDSLKPLTSIPPQSITCLKIRFPIFLRPAAIGIHGQSAFKFQSQFIRIIIFLIMSIKSTSLQHTLILLLLTCLIVPSFGFFCSSQCVDYSGACWNETTAGCIACAHNIFNIGADWTSTTPCTLLPQRTIVANELPNTPAMSLSGYSSTQVSPVTCSNYTFSGQYTSADYLFKNFTNIGLNHYQIIVRFNVGYIGTWSESDYLRVTLGDSMQIVNQDYYYSCGNGSRFIFDNITNITTITDYSENINGEVGYNSSDCVRIREYTLTHNTSYLTVKFSALTTEANPAVQFWGIKQLFVVTKDCHSYCVTCFGPLTSQCLSCAPGYYLQGNVCLQQCDPNFYIVLDTRICVSECPLRYYPNLAANTNIKQCLACQSGCRVCSSSSVCNVWDGQQAYVPDMWKDKMEFWILLIIILCAAIGLAIYKLMTKRTKDNDLEENMMSKSDDKDDDGKEKKIEDGSVNKITNTNESFSIPNDSIVDPYGPTLDLKGGDNLWFNELVEMEPVQVKVRGRKRRVKDIDPLSMNGLDAPSNANL